MKSSVLAAGVALFFMFLVRMFRVRLISDFNSWWHSYLIGKINKEIKSRENCWKFRGYFICSLLPVILKISSHVFNLSSILLWSPLWPHELDHLDNHSPATRFLYFGEIVQGKECLVVFVLPLPPVSDLLDPPSFDRWIRMVKRPEC